MLASAENIIGLRSSTFVIDTTDFLNPISDDFHVELLGDEIHLVYSAFVPTLPGDYNFDGTVDAADYIVWRKTDGSQDAYDIWRTNFGRSLSAGGSSSGQVQNGSVPEPATGFALLYGMCLAFLSRHR